MDDPSFSVSYLELTKYCFFTRSECDLGIELWDERRGPDKWFARCLCVRKLEVIILEDVDEHKLLQIRRIPSPWANLNDRILALDHQCAVRCTFVLRAELLRGCAYHA